VQQLAKVARWYRIVAVLAFSALLLLIALNLAFYAALQLKEYIKALVAPSNPVSEKYGEALSRVYPEMTRREVNDLLVETWTRGFVYEPLVQYKEAPHVGRFVNVHEAGFRRSKDQGPWPPAAQNYNVFLFGSSSVFGYGLPDDLTIASYLQQRLGRQDGRPVKIYNFGRGRFYSTQDRRLFERLLLAGYKPDAALFIHGLSEFRRLEDRLPYTERLERALDQDFFGNLTWMVQSMPLERMWRWVGKRLAGEAASAPEGADSPLPEHARPETLERLIGRWFDNRDLIRLMARQHDVPVLFIWQPVSSYKIGSQALPLGQVDMGPHAYAGLGYEMMAERLGGRSPEPDFIWCADIQEGVDEPLFVDAVHYNARMSELIAACIADRVARGALRP